MINQEVYNIKYSSHSLPPAVVSFGAKNVLHPVEIGFAAKDAEHFPNRLQHNVSLDRLQESVMILLQSLLGRLLLL